MWPKATKRCLSDAVWTQKSNGIIFFLLRLKNMPKHASEFLKYHVTGILKNEKADNSAIFWDINLKFATGAHLENVLDIFLRFFEKLKKWKYFQQHFFANKNCHTFSFLQVLKIEDSSFVAPSILRLTMPKNCPSLKNCARDNDSRRTLFCIKIDRTWRHSDVIFGRPTIGTKLLFGQDVWKRCTRSYCKFGAHISIRLEDIEEKQDGGSKKPPSQARVKFDQTRQTVTASQKSLAFGAADWTMGGCWLVKRLNLLIRLLTRFGVAGPAGRIQYISGSWRGYWGCDPPKISGVSYVCSVSGKSYRYSPPRSTWRYNYKNIP